METAGAFAPAVYSFHHLVGMLEFNPLWLTPAQILTDYGNPQFLRVCKPMLVRDTPEQSYYLN